MTENPLISIVVPIYQVEKFLPRCIESIQKQTYSNIEILLVDDGSPDACPDICEAYAKDDPRIRVIHQENGGLSAARNTGIAAAKGEYIGFVDSDDYIEPVMYEKLYRIMQKEHAVLGIANYDYVDEDGKPWKQAKWQSPLEDGILSGKQVLARILQDQGWYYVTAWNKLYHADLWKDLRYPPGKIHEDEFVAHRIYLRSAVIASTGEVLYHYVQNGKSIMNTGYSVKRLDRLEALTGRLRECSRTMGCLWTARMTWLMEAKFREAQAHLSESEDIRSRWAELKEQYDSCCRQLPGHDRLLAKVYREIQRKKR